MELGKLAPVGIGWSLPAQRPASSGYGWRGARAIRASVDPLRRLSIDMVGAASNDGATLFEL